MSWRFRVLRIATVGTSAICRRFIDAARSSACLEVVACYSRDADRAASFAKELDVGRGVGDFDALIGARDVDAIYVASPNSVHVEHVRRALEARKHVLCEKPLAPTAAEAESLFALSLEQDVVLLEGMRSTYDPGMAVVRELTPTLGVVRRVSFTYCQRSARYDRVLAGERVNIFDPALAGGALLDLGVYCAHPLVDLFGEPERVLAAQVSVASGADGAGVVVAVYPTLIADLSYSKITESSTPSEIQGELGTMLIDHISAPRHIVVEYHNGERTEVRPEGAENNLLYEIRRFVQVVASGVQPVEDTHRSLMAARLVDRARA
ncbi:MAG: Gfo/Idh/MocA family oxidoreductase [Dermatophilaceae bacterium]